MPEFFSTFNQIKTPEKETTEVAVFRTETNKKIAELLKSNTDLRRVAVLLGAEKYLEIIQTKGVSPTYHFNVKSFVDDQIAQKTFLKLPGEFLKTDEVILPPDPGEIIIGSGEGIDPKKIIPRSQFLVELLSEMNLDYKVIEGENSPNMMRQLSYYAFIIQKINKLALINNEEGNATFIIHQFEGDFEEARDYLNMTKEELKSLPQEIFSELIYPGDKEKWKMAMREFLGNGPKIEIEKEEDKKLEQSLSFEEAREKVREFGFKSAEDYRKKYKNIPGLPYKPYKTYKDKGWISWGKFLGTERIRQKPEQILSFEKAREKVRDLSFNGRRDYSKKYKDILGLPSNPEETYKNKGWISWMDFLGSKQFLSFKEAQKKVREFGFKSLEEYRKRYKDILGLPSDPYGNYKKSGWVDWADFLGKERIRQKSEQILSFEEAQKKAREFSFKSVEDYHKRYKDIPGLPGNPNSTYKNKGWISWVDFLDLESIHQKKE